MCLAKGISGGYLPLAATLTTEALFETFLGPTTERRTFFHGHTYTGNPLACAAGLASLQVFKDEQTLDRVQASSAHLSEILASRIAPLPAVREIRQRGLMVGIELQERSGRLVGNEVCRAARKHGILLRPLGSVVVLMPPLSFHVEQFDWLIAALRDSIIEIGG